MEEPKNTQTTYIKKKGQMGLFTDVRGRAVVHELESQ